jgi:7-carboxy-7-deazaguanine synthase
MLTISEIFHSIQGESTYAGLPCVFVRLAACDLRCRWCDTPYAFTGGTKMAVEDVVGAVDQTACRLVEVTGGEPLLQEDVYPLMQALLDRGLTVLLETGGHLSVERVPPGVVRIIDVKCPASGEAHRNHWANLEALRPTDEIKFVILDRADFDFAAQVVSDRGLSGRCASILFSPVHGVLEPAQLAAWVLAERLPVRVQLQVHKYIWHPDMRGV